MRFRLVPFFSTIMLSFESNKESLYLDYSADWAEPENYGATVLYPSIVIPISSQWPSL